MSEILMGRIVLNLLNEIRAIMQQNHSDQIEIWIKYFNILAINLPFKH